MVLLITTPAIIDALKELEGLDSDASRLQQNENDPPLDNVCEGSPISHGQIVDIWKMLRDAEREGYSLERLLKGSRVYVPPPPPKPEPSDEYKALMARLRRDEEQRAYERMTNPLPPTETFSQRFPGSNLAQTFAEANRPGRKDDLGDDDITYNDVHRQVMLIVNFMATILGVAATLWVLARWWSTPARLFLTMGGSIAVGIAEVVLYSGYIWHLGVEKKKDKTLKEVKQVVQTWVVGPEEKSGIVPRRVDHEGVGEPNVRRRRKDEGPTTD
ncbi:endoplasmic reticulum-based factor for assembly of V-ATPase-domain-containing protein [Echria macrotheca]|uniref:Endoplasmic reticulum-based factor for assembly of V-ATPase-domain-containing protein n=1 Tax=Echria macrotheca TaxID=438768 RepID=A0AAJ0B7E3_9PEZI|nr:endoplasmic reticulum-based factor for assembly of V-ATPase-domain-containing protein [Echria macrotheca]